MADYLRMFPLNLIVFPGERRGLYIFEERYKELIHECEQTSMTFGIPIVSSNQLAPIATEVRLVGIDQVMASGEMQITIEGLRRFRLISFKEKARGHLYPAGKVEWLNNDLQTDPALQKRVTQLINKLHRLLKNMPEVKQAPNELFTFDIGHQIGLNFEQKYRLLELALEVERLKFVEEHLNKELQKLKVKLNGHFENYILPDV